VLDIWVIEHPEKSGIHFTIINPWNRGFYSTPDPKCFRTEAAAQKFMEDNSINGVLKNGFLLNNGFHEGAFEG
jgi:hypothetical protein